MHEGKKVFGEKSAMKTKHVYNSTNELLSHFDWSNHLACNIFKEKITSGILLICSFSVAWKSKFTEPFWYLVMSLVVIMHPQTRIFFITRLIHHENQLTCSLYFHMTFKARRFLPMNSCIIKFVTKLWISRKETKMFSCMGHVWRHRLSLCLKHAFECVSRVCLTWKKYQIDIFFGVFRWFWYVDVKNKQKYLEKKSF